jgi:hypothetical protein
MSDPGSDFAAGLPSWCKGWDESTVADFMGSWQMALVSTVTPNFNVSVLASTRKWNGKEGRPKTRTLYARSWSSRSS